MRHWPDADTRCKGARAGKPPASPHLPFYGGYRHGPEPVLALAACSGDGCARERAAALHVHFGVAGRAVWRPRALALRRAGSTSGAPTGAPEGGAGTGPGPGIGKSAPRPNPYPPRPRSPVRTTDVTMTGDLPGWKQVFVEDFSAGDVPLGRFPGPLYSARWSAGYKDGTPDTAGQLSGGKSGYYPSKVLSVRNGVAGLVPALGKRDLDGGRADAQIPNASTTRRGPTVSSTAGTRSATGLMRCPDSRRPGSCGRTAASGPGTVRWTSPKGTWRNHLRRRPFMSGRRRCAVKNSIPIKSVTSWHVATIEWSPGRVEFFLDGRSMGVSTRGPDDAHAPDPADRVLPDGLPGPGDPGPRLPGLDQHLGAGLRLSGSAPADCRRTHRRPHYLAAHHLRRSVKESEKL